MKKLGLLAGTSALALLVWAAPTAASVTIGQVPTSTPPATCSNVQDDWLQPVEVSGTSYVVPYAGTITSWSTFASTNAGQRYKMKIFRPVAGSSYMVVGHDGPRSLTSGALNTFPANVPVKPGDLLGLNDNDSPPFASTACDFAAPGDTVFFHSGNLADGQSGPIAGPAANSRLNIQAVEEPTNSFTFGPTTPNRKRGTASLTVDVPNPGLLSASGPGVKAATSHAVSPGSARLLIRAKGRARKVLNATGKVKLRVSVTYTPTGGAPASHGLKVKLRKR